MTQSQQDSVEQLYDLLGDLWSHAFNDGSAGKPVNPGPDIAQAAAKLQQLMVEELEKPLKMLSGGNDPAGIETFEYLRSRIAHLTRPTEEKQS